MEEKFLKQKFDDLYNNEILPKIEPFETERLKLYDKWKFGNTCSKIFIVLLIGGSFLVSYVKLPVWLLIVWFVVIAVLCIFACDSMVTSKKFKGKLKTKLLVKILSVFGDFNVFTSSSLITLGEIKKYGLFPYAVSKTDDDNIAGFYNGMSLYLTETSLSHRVRKSSVIDFRGLIVKTVLNKNYEGMTVLSRKGNSYSRKRGMERVTLEDPEFNNLYEVFSDNQVEARYILTPSFMQRLKNIEDVFQAEDIHCVIKDKYITLFIENNEDFFEVGDIGDTLYDKGKFCQTYNELVSIFNLIHYFKLDKKLGL